MQWMRFQIPFQMLFMASASVYALSSASQVITDTSTLSILTSSNETILDEVFSSATDLAVSTSTDEIFSSSSELSSSGQDLTSARPRNVSDPGYVLLPLFTVDSKYFANLDLGSTQQSVTVQVDTASSDLWVMGSNVNCLASAYDCTGFGAFDTSLSTTYSANPKGPYYYNVGVQPWYAIGKWGTDDVMVGNLTVHDVTFAVSSTSDSQYGYLGIGPPTSESTNVNDDMTYDNFPLQLVSLGIIHRNVYSIYLDSASSGTGSVLFGAVDEAKFIGPLQTIAVINADSDINDFTVVLGEVTLSLPYDATGFNGVSVTGRRWPAVLDTTRNVTCFPAAMAEQLLKSSLFHQNSSSAYYVPEAALDSSYISFNFSGAAIDVPLKTFIVPLLSPAQVNFTILKSLTSTVFFGADVLRYMYRVYDVDRNQVSIAQANHTDNEDVRVIKDDVPSALQAAFYNITLVGYIPLLATGALMSYSAGVPSEDALKRSHGWIIQMMSILFGLCLI